MPMRAALLLLAVLTAERSWAQHHSLRTDIDLHDPVIDFFLRHPRLMGAPDPGGLVCEDTANPLAGAARDYLRRPEASEGDYSTGVSCTDLFSEVPPPALAPVWGGMAPRTGGWLPYCSLVTMRRQAFAAPTASMEVLLEQHSNRTRGLDHCTDRAESRGTVSAVVQTDVMTSAERQSKKETVRGFIQRAREGCCAVDDHDCRAYFGDIGVSFCSELEGSRREKCYSNRASAGVRGMDSGLWYFFRGPLSDPHTPISAHMETMILLSPSFFEEPHWRSTLVHEMAHACSFYYQGASVRRQMPAFPSGEYEFHPMFDRLRRECTTDLDIEDFYRGLFQRQGLSPRSAACLLSLGSTAVLSRFPPTRTCPEACPRSHLEEAHAEVAELIYAAEQTPDVLRGQLMCGGIRDEAHPLKADVLRCLLHTPRIRQSIEHASRCVR